jgi:late competence protein required for DNA uptake (superfamily II DNA/RNA helicase)
MMRGALIHNKTRAPQTLITVVNNSKRLITMVNKCVGTRVTESTYNAIEQVIASNGHVNIADYLRDLIRIDLEKRGLMK